MVLIVMSMSWCGFYLWKWYKINLVCYRSLFQRFVKAVACGGRDNSPAKADDAGKGSR
jgi:hypothetical protein